MFELNYMSMTHPGLVRSRNEDNFYIDGLWKKDPEQLQLQYEGTKGYGQLLAAVCDGMGGEELGEIASLLAVQTIAELNEYADKKMLFAKYKATYLDEYVQKANERICRRMKTEEKTMGSTIAILEFYREKVRALNMGDSRIYRLHLGKLEQISTDHTVVARLIQSGQITGEEGRNHPMQHRVTQYLGIFQEEMLLEPAVTDWIPLKEGDLFLICSDGLTDMLMDHEIAEILRKEKTVGNQGKQLLCSALESGGRDNITMVLVQVGKRKGIWERARKR